MDLNEPVPCCPNSQYVGWSDGKDQPLTQGEYENLTTCFSKGGRYCILYNFVCGIPMIPVACGYAWVNATCNGVPHRDRFTCIYRSCFCVPKQAAYPCACPCVD